MTAIHPSIVKLSEEAIKETELVFSSGTFMGPRFYCPEVGLFWLTLATLHTSSRGLSQVGGGRHRFIQIGDGCVSKPMFGSFDGTPFPGADENGQQRMKGGVSGEEERAAQVSSPEDTRGDLEKKAPRDFF